MDPNKPMTVGEFVKYAKKTMVAALTALLTGLVAATDGNLLPEEYARWAPVVIAVLGTFGVYAVRNTTRKKDETSSTASEQALTDDYVARHDRDTMNDERGL